MTSPVVAEDPGPEAGADVPKNERPAQPGSNRFLAEAGRVLLSVAIIGAGVAGMFSFGKSEPPPKKAGQTDKAPLVDTVEIIAHQGRIDLSVDGLTVPYKEILLSAEVAGRIAFKSDACQAGSFVKAGTPLLRIDPSTYELEVARLKGSLKEADQNLTELTVEIANTDELIVLANDDLSLRNNELARQRRLASTGVGTTTALEAAQGAQLQSQNARKTLENQKRLLVTRKARLQTSRELAKIRLDQAELDLARTNVVAPVSGVIISEMVEADSYVQPGAGLLAIEDTSRIEVRCSLTMEELYRLWQSSDADAGSMGQNGEYSIPPAPVRVLYELAGRTFVWQGRLSRYDGLGIDQKTRTVPCRVVVTKPGEARELHADSSLTEVDRGPRALVRGMFVQVQIHTKPTSRIVRVPELAVRPGNKVWLVRDGELSIHDAVLAGLSETDLLLDSEASDIRAGDRVVISPLANVIDGMQVREKSQ